MPNIQQELTSVKEFFRNIQISLSDVWLESCISWFREEQDGAPYTEKQLQSVVYDQWLVFDLREVELPQLPPNIQNVMKLVLHKTIALQVLSIVDISKPKLQQLNSIRKSAALTRGIDEDDADNRNNYGYSAPKRMLQLTLTDGVQEIKAIEYKPIPCLNLNLSPGVKIKIVGPITIRRGTMMLEPHHVKLLGGEVEEILVSNAAENVLARFLHLPENPNPSTLNDSVNESRILDNPRQNINCTIANKTIVQTNISTYFNNNSNEPSTSASTNKKQQCKNNVFVDEEEELRIAEEIDSLLETERELRIPQNAPVKDDGSKQSFIDEVEEKQITQEIDKLLEAELDVLGDSAEQTTPQKTKAVSPNSPELFDDSDMIKPNSSAVLRPSDLVDLQDGLFASLEIGKRPAEENKIYTLGEVKEIIGSKRSGTYTTFAKFKSVERKLTVGSEGWDLQISVESDDDALTVKMHSSVVTEMVGYSPEEVMAMRRDIQEKNAAAANLIMQAIDGFRLKLLELNCLIEIEYEDGNNLPCIVKLL